MSGKRPVRVGDVYDLGFGIRFEVTAFDLMSPKGPTAIGVESVGDRAAQAHHAARRLVLFCKLMSGGTGQAVEVSE